MALLRQPPTEFTALKSWFYFLYSEHALKDVCRIVSECGTLRVCCFPHTVYSYFVCPFNLIVIFFSYPLLSRLFSPKT